MKNFIAIKIESRGKIHPEFKKIIREGRLVLLGVKQEIDEAEQKGACSKNLLDKGLGALLPPWHSFEGCGMIYRDEKKKRTT